MELLLIFKMKITQLSAKSQVTCHMVVDLVKISHSKEWQKSGV